QKRCRDPIRNRKLWPDPAAALRKHQSEVDEQRRLIQQGCDVGPVDNPVKRIQLAAVVKAVKNERDKAEDVEMNGARSVPAAREDEKADKKVQECREAQIIFYGRGIFLRRRYERGFKGRAIPAEPIANFNPRPYAKQNACNVCGAMNGVS